MFQRINFIGLFFFVGDFRKRRGLTRMFTRIRYTQIKTRKSEYLGDKRKHFFFLFVALAITRFYYVIKPRARD